MIEFQNLQALWLLFLLIPAALFLFLDYRRGKRDMEKFWDHNESQKNIRLKGRGRYPLYRAILLLLFLLSGILALLRPVGNPELATLERRGRDVVIVLDVSRSMDAEDIYPSRLERAKWEIMDTLPEMAGDRVALILFAGSTLLTCPLTSDQAFMAMALDGVSTSSVSRGGTLLGDALRDTEKIISLDGGSLDRDILLITDGGDHESFPVEAATSLGEKGVRLLIIGLGADKGTPIPDGEGGSLIYQGEEVLSSLDHELLKSIASATPGGRYLPVGTGSFQLSSIYRDFIRSGTEGQVHQEDFLQYQEYYQFFLILGILALIAYLLLNLLEWRSKK